MKCVKLLVVVAAFCFYCCSGSHTYFLDDEENDEKWPTIGVSILVKNKSYSLPYALTALQQLDYPKDRMYVWIYNDKSSDESVDIINTWADKFKYKYNGIYVTGDKSVSVPETDAEWTPEKLQHIIHLREKALRFARKKWVDYIFMMDADVILVERNTLKQLVRQQLPIVAPMLLSDGLYSNFWGNMSKKYYYERCELYQKITDRETMGCFEVPMVHSAVLVELRSRVSDELTYEPRNIPNYDGPMDDIIAFAISAKKNGVGMSVCNEQIYGFLPVPVDLSQGESTELDQMLNVKMEALAHGIVLPVDSALSKFVKYPAKDRLGVDQVFWINLERRPERRKLMEAAFQELGVDADRVSAVDGMGIDLSDLSSLGITLMPNYEDPYHKRPMKTGEIGCFLSHLNIWKEMASRSIGSALILEDDVRFVPFFRRGLQDLQRELALLPGWDLVYIGRKILESQEEVVSARVVRPGYSYWTLGYMLSEAGARKLLRAEPAAKVLPVDELLPIMYDKHPNDTWKSYFRRRDLDAYSAAPLLVFPTHYTGEPGYVSDTEGSSVLPPPDGLAGSL